MHFKLDHIVHMTDDPLRAVIEMQDLGFHAVIGGEHANWGTQNGLCHFGLSYIEFLGIKHLDIAERVTDNTLIQQLAAGEKGLARLALRTQDIEQAARRFRKQGLQTIGPVQGSRKQPDGKLLEWAMLFIEDGSPDRFRLPFIIDWKVSDAKREQQLKERGFIEAHPIGHVKLDDIMIATLNLEKTLKEWEILFNSKIVDAFTIEEWNARCTTIFLEKQKITFCEPIGDGTLKDIIKSHGERPFRIAFSGTGQKTVNPFLDADYCFRK